MQQALAEHDTILRQVIGSNHGQIIKTTGDGIHAVFEKAVDAVMAALEVQHRLQVPIRDLQLKVRMGLHTGEAELRDGDYYGPALNRTARIMSVGYGGQVLLSGITAEVVRDHLPIRTSLMDLGEHRLRDLVRPERLFQLNAHGLVSEFPALRTLNTNLNNLPVQLTSFIGRKHELGEVKERLASTRLLTLIGPGGTGKTRLTLQLAVDLLPSFTDGVWFVELAPLSDPSLVLQTIASVLGVREQLDMGLVDIVINYLRTKNLLLILDNCAPLSKRAHSLGTTSCMPAKP